MNLGIYADFSGDPGGDMCVLGYSLGYPRHGSFGSSRARLTVEFFTYTDEQVG